MINQTGGTGPLTMVAPSGGVVSGVPVVIEAVLVVPVTSTDEGQRFAAHRTGEYTLSKVVADTPAAWAKAYYKTDTGEFTATASGNKLAGVFAAAGVSGSESASVMLTGELL